MSGPGQGDGGRGAAPGRGRHRVSVAPANDTFLCRPDETLLKAGLEAGLRLPYDCSTGTCGSCRARLVAGAVAARWPDAPGLSGRDRRKGRILCCQSEPRGPVRIEVEQEAPDARPRPGAHTCRVTEIHALTADTRRLVCALEAPLGFRAGQYVLFVIPGTSGRRAYSMCGRPGEEATLDFVVKAKPGGVATRFLFDRLRPGDPLQIEGPYGRAWLRQPLERDVVCAAGGSGLGPMLSIVRQALAEGSEARRVSLVFGVQRHEDLFDLDALAELSAAHPRFEAVVALSTPQAGWSGETGLVPDVLLRRVPDVTERDLYMAGPPGMIDAALRVLVHEGQMPLERVRFDRFS